MECDEEFYEIAAEEFEKNPRQGLLIKCITNSEGDEKRGKALYIKTRVSEMKNETVHEKKNLGEENEKKISLESDLESLDRNFQMIFFAFVLMVVVAIIVNAF